MKKHVLALALIGIIPIITLADPPKKVILSYNAGKLKIEAVHPVKDVKDHYIDLINISVDGKEVKVIKPKEQSSAAEELIEVAVPEIKSGSKVEVKARCNKFGSKKETLEVK